MWSIIIITCDYLSSSLSEIIIETQTRMHIVDMYYKIKLCIRLREKISRPYVSPAAGYIYFFKCLINRSEKTNSFIICIIIYL